MARGQGHKKKNRGQGQGQTLSRPRLKDTNASILPKRKVFKIFFSGDLQKFNDP